MIFNLRPRKLIEVAKKPELIKRFSKKLASDLHLSCSGIFIR